jgi:hypothetical protein
MLRFVWNPQPAREALIRAAKDAMRDMATYTAQRAVDYAPIDTGFMAHHIQMIELAGDEGFRVISPAFYSIHVHAGFVSRAGTWVPGRPFITWALADAAQQWPTIAGRHRVGTGGEHNPEGFLGTTFST